MDIFPAPFFLMEKLSFLLMMSSPRKILMNVLRQSATGMRAAALMPMRPSESQSTDNPVIYILRLTSQSDIGKDSAIGQKYALRHIADTILPLATIIFTKHLTINTYLTLSRAIKTKQEVKERSLSRT